MILLTSDRAARLQFLKASEETAVRPQVNITTIIITIIFVMISFLIVIVVVAIIIAIVIR